MWWSKTPQRAKPERCFAEPEPPDQGGEQLPFVRRSRGVLHYFIHYLFNFIDTMSLDKIFSDYSYNFFILATNQGPNPIKITTTNQKFPVDILYAFNNS